jgi:GT2 family glycosyltransferase
MQTSKAKEILVSIIIPHFNGKEVLTNCLNSIVRNGFKDYEIIVVDNGSTDGSQDLIRNEFKNVALIENEVNKGYAGGCNSGISKSEGKYILFLNNDVEVAENFLEEMYIAIDSDEHVGLVQPKLLSMQKKTHFDYSGGAGGEIDIFGFPFARGRVFVELEKDESQYDDMTNEIFWASGTAVLVRKSLLDIIGFFDEDFFAHMEEIDLNWRAQLVGYKSIVTLNTFLYHYSGYTLPAENPRKMYLNHRNNLIMILKNYSFLTLLWVFPIRLLLELIALTYAIVSRNKNWAIGVINGVFFVFKNFGSIWRKHLKIQNLRTISDSEIMRNMYKGSVALTFFLRIKNVNQICGFKKKII